MKAAMIVMIGAGCVLGGCVIQPADVAGRGELSAVIVSAGPKIDGTLDDSIWQACPPLELGRCGSDEVGELKSAARVLFDEKNLYVAVECHEPDTGRLTANVAGRDADVWHNDSVDVFVHPQGAAQARHFIVACNGELLDALETGGDAGDTSWNSSAVVAVKVNKNKSWIVTLSVPLAELGAEPGKDQTWPFNINRTRPLDGGQWAESSWSRSGRSDYHDTTGWGKVTGLNVP